MRIAPVLVVLIIFGSVGFLGCVHADSLSGSVTYNGEPVENGSITFASADGSGPGFGAKVVDGRYKTDKVRRGQHIVYVRGLTKAPRLTREVFAKLREQSGKRAGLPVDYIPENAAGNSQTLEIEGGRQVLDFKIKGPPRRN
jgi:hypothetical protein